MENSKEIQFLLEEIHDALNNNISHDKLINFINEECYLNGGDLDLLVGMLEDKGHQEFAALLSDEIHTPTLENELERQRPWHENTRCTRMPSDEISYLKEKLTLQLYKTLHPDGQEVIYSKPECRRYHNDL
jgi:hypothetical protein